MQKAEILTSFTVQLSIIRSAAEKYISKFNGDGILKLFDDSSDAKKYLDRYAEFTKSITEPLTIIENDLARLSLLVLEADRSCDKENTASLSSIFESCEAFLCSVSLFFKTNNKNFDNAKGFKSSISLSSARTLKVAIDNFIKICETDKQE